MPSEVRTVPIRQVGLQLVSATVGILGRKDWPSLGLLNKRAHLRLIGSDRGIERMNLVTLLQASVRRA
jgi:hypothetical protein